MRSRFIFFILTMGGFLSVNHVALANMDLEQCMHSAQAAIEQNNGWQVIQPQCPIGDGLWDKAPAHQNSQFWIQCGVTGALPKPWFANELKKNVAADKIVLRREEGRYRCLLGPFSHHASVQNLKNSLKNNKHLKNAFIREVPASMGSSLAAAATQAAPAREKRPTPLTKPELSYQVQPTVIVSDIAKKDDQVDALTEEVFERRPEKTQIPAKPKYTAQSSREFIQIENLHSPEPYIDDLHHIEAQRAWLRASLPEANQICQRNGMSLVSINTLREIANSKVRREKLPKRLPFWVSEQKAYDMAMMVPIRLTENSALYVMCEK